MENNFLMSGELVGKMDGWETGKFIYVKTDAGTFEICAENGNVFNSAKNGDLVSVAGTFHRYGECGAWFFDADNVTVWDAH